MPYVPRLVKLDAEDGGHIMTATREELEAKALAAEEAARQTGRTTRQMKAAPNESTYIWCNQHTDYPKRLARSLGRLDLRIVGPGELMADRVRGRREKVVIDHAFWSICEGDARYYAGIDWLHEAGLL